MTKIIANNIHRQQMIFDTYLECADYFNVLMNKIKRSVDTGEPLRTDKGVWFFDILEEA